MVMFIVFVCVCVCGYSKHVFSCSSFKLMLSPPTQEIEVAGKKAIILYIPVRLQRQFQKIQVRLMRELEKKFSGRTVVFLTWVCWCSLPHPSLSVCLCISHLAYCTCFNFSGLNFSICCWPAGIHESAISREVRPDGQRVCSYVANCENEIAKLTICESFNFAKDKAYMVPKLLLYWAIVCFDFLFTGRLISSLPG